VSEVDLIILVCIAISAFISFLRGFLREALSLGTWIVAIVVTLVFTSRFATYLPLDAVESPLARASISALVLFVGALVTGSLTSWIITHLIAKESRGFTDRLIGVVFGVFRGALLVSLLVLAANLVPDLKREQWWQESTLLPRFQNAAAFLHSRMPPSIAQYLDIDKAD